MIIRKQERIKNFFDQEYIKSLGIDNFEKHFKDHFVDNWCYDLGLGDEAYITSNETPTMLSDSEPYVVIKPGEFALLTTYERLKLDDDVMAFISVRFTYKKKGLINISGFHVDPNYKGRLIFSVYNAGPNDILLKYKDPVFMIFFQQLENLENGQINTYPSTNVNLEARNEPKLRESFDHIPVSFISEIKGQSTTLADNRQKIERLEHLLKVYGTIAVGLVTTLIGAFVAYGLGILGR